MDNPEAGVQTVFRMPGVLTVLFTDLVGSTELLQRLGDDAMEVTRREHFATLRQCVAAHGGTEVKSVGDGLMAVFGSTVEAVEAAIQIQQEVDRQATEVELGVRIGLHVGEPIVEGDDYSGTVVVVAKRLCDAAYGGQILTSHLVKGLVGTRVSFPFRDLEDLELKGLEEPVAVAEVVWVPDRSSAVPMPAPLALGDLTPFVGRESEMDALRTAAKRAEEGRPHLITVGGEPGIGKTRLAAEFVRGLHDQGWTVMFGRSDEQALTPFQPFCEALGAWVSVMGADTVRATLDSQASELARLVPAFGDPPSGTDSDRYRLFEAVSDLLSDISARAPLVFVIDDLHWADQPSLLMLRHLLRATDAGPILYVGTYRETELGRTHPLAQALADMRREARVDRVSLRGLTVDQVIELLSAAAGHDVGGRGHKLAVELWHATEGNPFFIESIVRHLVDSGRIFLRDGMWTYDSDVSKLGIPEGVKEVIGQRLSRLGECPNEVLRAAAVLGRDFNFDVLVRVSGRTTDEVLEALDEAIGAQLVTEVPGESLPTYSFTHALIRQTLYEELHLARKQRMHLKAGEAIEGVHARDLDPLLGSLAVHYRLAGAAADPDRAISFSFRAGLRALALFGYEEAAEHWEATLELMEDAGRELEEVTRLRERLGDLLFLSGIDYDRSERYMNQALVDYERLGHAQRAAQVHSKLGRNLSTFPPRMDIPRAMEHFRAALPLIGSAGPASLTHLKLAQANAYLWGLRNLEGAETSAEALELAEQAGNPGASCLARALLGWFRFSMGELRDGKALMEQAWHEADAMDRTFAAFSAAWMRAGASQFLGDPSDSIAWAERELAKPRMAEAPQLRHQLELMIRMGQYLQGSLSELEDDEIEPTRRFVAMLRGEMELARQFAVEDGESFTRTGNVMLLSGAVWGEGLSKVWLGDPDAERTVRRCLEIIEGGQNRVLGAMTRCLLAIEICRSDRSPEANDILQPVRDQMTDLEDWRGNAASLHLAEAVLTSTTAGPHDAEGWFTKALETSDRYGIGPYEAEILLRWGRALVEVGDVRAGTEKLDRAAEIYRSLGMGEFWVRKVDEARPR